MTNHSFKRPSLRHHPRHVIRRLFNGWPWLVWIGTAIMVMVLLPGGLHRHRFHGEAESIYEYVSPLHDGRLKTLNVAMGDMVEPGQLIGELDIEALMAELLMEQTSFTMETQDVIHSIRADLEKTKLGQSETIAQLRVLEALQKRNRELVQSGLMLEQEVEDLEPQIRAINDVLALYPQVIQEIELRLKVAGQDIGSYDPSILGRLVSAQSQLKSSTAGVVAKVLHQPGDIVMPGDPVVLISNILTSRVIAFMSEDDSTDLPIGERCRIITQNGKKNFYGVVKSITADIRLHPVYTGFGYQYMRGRLVVVELEEGTLRPGEKVVVVPNISIFEQWFGRKK